MTEVLQCILLDNHRLELYWNNEISGAENVDNYKVTNGNKAFHLHVWKEPEEWDKGCLYEKERKRTTLYLEECIYPYHLCDLTITFSEEIKDLFDHPVKRNLECRKEYKPFYEKYTISQNGIVIKSSRNVSDEAHAIASKAADHMLEKIPDVAAVMRRFHAEIAIYGLDEYVYDIPEHRYGYNVLHRPVEGFGGVSDLPVTSVSECNLLRCTEGKHATRYINEFIMAHEFGHAVHLIGINYCRDQKLAEKLLTCYKNACDAGRWPKTYAIGNYEEYFATLTSMWFGVMAESADGTWDGVRGPVNTRKEMQIYDPEAYDFFAEIYPEEGFGGKWEHTPNLFNIDGTRRNQNE